MHLPKADGRILPLRCTNTLADYDCYVWGKLPTNNFDYGGRLLSQPSTVLPGGCRIFRVCPYCGHEIDNKVGPVDENGIPIPTER